MKLDKKRIRPFTLPLVNFTGDRIVLKGIVILTVIAGTYSAQVTKEIDFLIVNCPSTYNIILGRPALNKLKAVTSIYHLKVKFPTAYGIGEIKGDQVLARECYQVALASGENHTWVMNELEPIPESSKIPQEIEIVLGDSTKVLKIKTILLASKKEKMISFLRANQDVFTWKHEDMPKIDRKIIQYRLNVNPECKPIQQKRRIFSLEHNKAVTEEVEKLLEADFIREVFYSDWLANVIMVKKSDDKCRMCIDFIDLNKACPKDSFPLPRIDQLVDSTARHKLLSFMDLFSGYNQILMDEDDQEKTSFVTSQGLYCYKIGRNVEVYVDDMLVKSKDEANHLDDLKEIFNTLRKFLGFMMSQRGIEANPDKVKAIIEVKSPKIVKEGGLDPRIMQYIYASSLIELFKVPDIEVDHALITALVERWRSETHTFHLPHREMGITLQDIEVMLGILVDVLPVTGRADHQWNVVC
ncbi:uncharacterized protein LOC115980462 [Quercus lobata]|uniref:uncharacterized protein LOC115980462 n=1 Tax=Quercus lobata TaxID=97700 RepID=UPI001247C07F|nr:uncharacterized protein LOC115980462 [Quercus lobata]